MSSISNAYDREIRPFIDLIDQFRMFGVQQDSIDLPQICVMGDQSSGKSSVLQAISGIEFPRGSGLVTRCPTQLIMSKSLPGTSWSAEVSVSGNHADPPHSGAVQSPEKLTSIIMELTDYLTKGRANDFSTDSIVIKIQSPDAPDLTLIDLPGIVRTSTSGQDATVIGQVNELINRYISLPRTIILAVIPSNQDIATIDILERAQKADPEGIRTIGVLTKPDLIGSGGESEVVEVLRNVRKPLALGYIMVKNLSQRQVNEGVTQQEAKVLEREFFNNHPDFSRLSPSLFGVENLVAVLTKVLVSNIKRSLPDIKRDLENMLQHSLSELEQLGKAIPNDIRDQQALIMDKISAFCRSCRQSSRGDYREGILASNPQSRLHIQMQWTYKSFQSHIQELKPAPGSTVEAMLASQLQVDMVELRGRELSCFLNSQVLFANVVTLVEAWRPHMENCKAEVFQHARGVSSTIATAIAGTFPELASAINSIAQQIIDSLGDEVSDKLEALLLREQDPFTAQDVLLNVVNKIRFQAFEKALQEYLDAIPAPAANAPINLGKIRDDTRKQFGKWYMQRHGVDAKGNIHEMVTLIQAYWDLSSRRFIDNICMCLEKEITTKFVQELETQCFMFGISLDSTTIQQVLVEQPEAAARRRQMFDTSERMKKSLKALRDLAPDLVA